MARIREGPADLDETRNPDDDEASSLWGKLLVSGGALLGVAAAYNAFARRGVDRVPNLIGGEEGGWSWRGRRISFTKRGEGPALLLVHGIHAAAWSYEWRHNVDYLARDHTVYTIDLLGFGRSDRPPIRYTSRTYISLLSDFVAQVVGGSCILVANSLSAAYAIILGARDPHRFPALVLIQPTGLTRLNGAAGVGGDAGRMAIDTPVLGTAAFNALVSRRSLRHFLEEAYADNALVTPELLDASYDVSHQRGARHAPAAFIAGHLNIDVRRALRRLNQPALLFWGEEAQIAPVEEVRGFRSLKRDLDVHILSPAGDLPQDERPDDFNVILSTWLNRRSLSSVPTHDTLPGMPEDSPLTPPAS
ncbi:MAG: alpha/beta fold hydrolase [Gemmatimonadota bacterium]|nr:alpha/beta fold hydrolase [Gemmatimonadota bacterium]